MLYWMQTEAPRPDGGTGFPGLRLRPDVMGTADGLAQAPYHRESPPHPGGDHGHRERRLVRGARRPRCDRVRGLRRRRHVPHRPAPLHGRRQLHRRRLDARSRSRSARCCRAGSRTCSPPTRTSAPRTSRTAATGCTRSSGTSARPPGMLAAHCVGHRPHSARRPAEKPSCSTDFQHRARRRRRRAALDGRRPSLLTCPQHHPPHTERRRHHETRHLAPRAREPRTRRRHRRRRRRARGCSGAPAAEPAARPRARRPADDRLDRRRAAARRSSRRSATPMSKRTRSWSRA